MKKTTLLLGILLSALFFNTGCCKQQPDSQTSSGNTAKNTESGKAGSADQKENVVDRPLDILSQTGLNYSLDSARQKSQMKSDTPGGFFETQYLEGIALMEKGEYTKAVSLFEAIVQRYPNSEEASVAELCIAELYFRNKSNDRALEAYRQIVDKYPNSHAAENARAGIRYLEDFEKYEHEYVPADVEDRKRRGF